MWITVIVGLKILLFQRLYLNRPQFSLIDEDIVQYKASDFVLIAGKIAALLFLLRIRTKITRGAVAVALLSTLLYVLNVDVVSVYAT